MPMTELARNIRWLIGANIICWGFLTIAVLVIGYLTWNADRERIADSQRTIINLCRELNTRNLDLKILLLDAGFPSYRVDILSPVSCNPSQLEKG